MRLTTFPSRLVLAFLLVGLGGTFQSALAQPTSVTVTVPGTANPWLAEATSARCGDSAPGQSPVLVPIALVPGSTLSFTASGGAGFGPTSDYQSGPDGTTWVLPGTHPAENGCRRFALSNSLLGVFVLGSGEQTIFLIGSSKTAVVPRNATALYLGIMDGCGRYDNSGAFTVSIQAQSSDSCYPSSMVALAEICAASVPEGAKAGTSRTIATSRGHRSFWQVRAGPAVRPWSAPASIAPDSCCGRATRPQA